jgi:hypothetical protein
MLTTVHQTAPRRMHRTFQLTGWRAITREPPGRIRFHQYSRCMAGGIASPVQLIVGLAADHREGRREIGLTADPAKRDFGPRDAAGWGG